ncbi:hypothetical protein SAMN05216390_10644 [Lachnospiraceae bacterium KH1T2]|nr:hypothetical protein SAMN05216390_10644 [Lachnospiraceae bacterium KH1T2]
MKEFTSFKECPFRIGIPKYIYDNNTSFDITTGLSWQRGNTKKAVVLKSITLTDKLGRRYELERADLLLAGQLKTDIHCPMTIEPKKLFISGAHILMCCVTADETYIADYELENASKIILRKITVDAASEEDKSFYISVLDKDHKEAMQKAEAAKADSELKGFPLYIQNTSRCLKCKHPMEIFRNFKKQYSMKCPKCGNTAEITEEYLNDYIKSSGALCPRHNSKVEAATGKIGIFVRCSEGHMLRPDEI